MCKKWSTIGLVIGLVLATVAIPGAIAQKENHPSKNCEIDDPSRSILDHQQVTINIEFSSCADVSINVINKATEIRESVFAIRVDGRAIQKPRFEIRPNQSMNWTYEVTPNLDLTKNNHTVTVTTYGNRTQYNFTRDINYANGTEIPHTHIEDVEVTNGTIDGEPSAVAKVTLSNPSIQMYSTKLMVYTEGTDGSLYGASVAPGENRTITVELLEERGAKVAGEARLYAGNVSEREGGLDQVEFVGRAGSNTTTWNESYEPVTGPWRDDHYVYQNESIETGADRNGIVPDLSETQLLYAGAGVALVGLGGLKRLLT